MKSLSVVAQTYNPITRKVEAGRFPGACWPTSQSAESVSLNAQLNALTQKMMCEDTDVQRASAAPKGSREGGTTRSGEKAVVRILLAHCMCAWIVSPMYKL